MKAIGVDGSEPPLDRVEEIASRYLDEIVKVRPKGPYIVSGYSVGGLMAFELALQMQKRGLEVAKVIALDTFAAGYPKRLSWPTIRLGIHIANRLSRPGERKWAYLAHRFRKMAKSYWYVRRPPNIGKRPGSTIPSTAGLAGPLCLCRC